MLCHYFSSLVQYVTLLGNRILVPSKNSSNYMPINLSLVHWALIEAQLKPTILLSRLPFLMVIIVLLIDLEAEEKCKPKSIAYLHYKIQMNIRYISTEQLGKLSHTNPSPPNFKYIRPWLYLGPIGLFFFLLVPGHKILPHIRRNFEVVRRY